MSGDAPIARDTTVPRLGAPASARIGSSARLRGEKQEGSGLVTAMSAAGRSAADRIALKEARTLEKEEPISGYHKNNRAKYNREGPL